MMIMTYPSTSRELAHEQAEIAKKIAHLAVTNSPSTGGGGGGEKFNQGS
jgi:hypothetical protein